MSQEYRYNFTCPCGITISVDSHSLFEKLIAGHDFAHIERVIELKKPPAPTLNHLLAPGLGQTINNDCCSNQTAEAEIEGDGTGSNIDFPGDGTGPGGSGGYIPEWRLRGKV